MPDTAAPPSPRLALVTGVLDLGGTTTFMCNLAGELVRRGVAAEVFSFSQENPLAEDFRRLNIPVFTTNPRRWIYEDRLRLILQELARFQPSAVLANLTSTSFEVLRYLPAGVCRIGTAQSHDPGVYATVRPYTPYLDRMGAVSRTIEQSLRALPEFQKVPVSYQPYGVPMPALPPPRRFDQPLRVLYLGRLQREQKRVQLFPEILQDLQAAGIPFHWTIAGTGPEADWLQRSLKVTAPGQSVSFPGKVLYADVPKLLAEHDLFLLASDYEGLPLSLLEAMAYGLVPVVSDLPSGVREVVDATTGKLVSPDHTAGYARAIVQLHRQREELRQLSTQARQRVQTDFSVPAMTDRWLQVLPPPQPVVWPQTWKIGPILVAPDPWRFSPPLRWLRRLLLRLRYR